jgi:hypothetical protein
MSTLVDFLDLLVDLSKALFKDFATAVSDYPLPTIVVFAGVFYFLHANSWFTPYDERRNAVKTRYSVSEICAGFAGFVVAVILSNVFGYIFNAVISVIGWFFRMASVSFEPFSKHPLEFVSFLLGMSVVGFIYLFISARWKIRNSNPVRVFITAFAILFATYISTSLYVAIRGGDAAAATKPRDLDSGK